VVDWGSQKFTVIDMPFASRHYRMALDPSGSHLAISGPSQVRCYRADGIDETLPDPIWETDVVRGFIDRLRWVPGPSGRLVASTVGAAAEPALNGLYLLGGGGNLLGMHLLTTRSHVCPDEQQAGIRDVRAASLMSQQEVDLVAVADDSRLYVWSPY